MRTLFVLALDAVGQAHPRMPARFVDRDRRRREGGIGERADRHRDELRRRSRGVEDRGPAVRAEVKLALFTVVRHADVVGVAARDADATDREPRLQPERAAGPALAGEAVTDRDPERIALRRQAKLPAGTGGLARLHRPDPTGPLPGVRIAPGRG